MGAVCGTDVYSKLLKEYGGQFTQFIVAEKAKTAVTTHVSQFRTQLDSIYGAFTNQTNQQFLEKTNIVRTEFENAKNQLNSRIPGGVQLIQRTKGQPIEQILGFNDIMAKIDGMKNDGMGLVQAKHMEASNYINTTQNNAIAQIEQTKPQIPLFSRLPDSMQKMVLEKGENEFRKDIESNNSKVLGALSQQLNLQQFQSVLNGLNPSGPLDGLLRMAQGNFMNILQQLLGLGGGGNPVASVGNVLGGMGGSMGNIGQQAFNGLTNAFSGPR